MRPDCALILPIPISIADDRGAAFLRFAGATPLTHCLRRMLEPHPWIGHAVVMVADALLADVRASLAADGLSSVRVVAAQGSGTRAECLAAGLAELDDTTIYALVHDIHHPLAPAHLRNRVIESLRPGRHVVVPALTMVDSVKAVDSVGTVTRTVDRELLRSAQFPRGFLVSQLDNGLQEHDGREFDELEYALRSGIPITMVDGHPDAFALEMPRDARLAEAIVSCRLEDRR